MLERDLQDYLYENPSVLFPEIRITRRSREVVIEGKRIDLLFETEESAYIIELKAVPITREHIGQVFEYYGLMRRANKNKNYKMILVSPSIPQARRVLLEEIGVRCVEIQSIPSSASQIAPIQAVTREFRKRDDEDDQLPAGPIRLDDFTAPATRSVLSTSHRLLRDTSVALQTLYSEYVVVPIRMSNTATADLICRDPSERELGFSTGGVWWAYNFGESEEMPKNNVPNISAVGMPWGFDLTINAEILSSQRLMRRRIEAEPSRFDQIIRDHGNVQLQMILKLERQPRFYYWIRLLAASPSHWDSRTVLEFNSQLEADFDNLRAKWISRISSDLTICSPAQVAHMKTQNKRLNLAIRLARPFVRDDEFWRVPYPDQCRAIVDECRRFKPLIAFFR